jgi:hypothetical protein
MAPTNRGKGALTLEKLAMYDDVITDALVDKVGRERDITVANMSRARANQCAV